MIRPAILLALAISTVSSPQGIEPMQTATELTHVTNTFRFEVHAPLDSVAPLFGPEAERSWAGKHWNPEFLYPRPAKDIQGAVFTVPHGQHKSVWVNTVFDVPGGRMQYVSFIPDVLVTTVDVKLTTLDKSHTSVEVTYVRTALQPDANDHVRELGNSDRDSGPQWKESIDTSLGLKTN